MDKLFYLRSRHGDTGTNVMFHHKNGNGYGTNLNKLHVFTLAEAQKELDHDVKSLPLLKSEVDKLAIKAVDCQNLDLTKNQYDCFSKYCIQLEGHWNGNDIAFVTGSLVTYDYGNAEVFTYDDGIKYIKSNPKTTLWDVEYLNTICRSTFQSHNINTRKMITGPGVKYNKPRKPRPTTGKTRGNCPECGRITWDYNPYEPAYCKYHSY